MLVNHLLVALFAGSAVAAPTVYLIRHGEKPTDDSNGLSAQGAQRAQCLRNVFGSSSQYNIGYILAETPKSSSCSMKHLSFSSTFLPFDSKQSSIDKINANTNCQLGGARARPLLTVQPVASDLGLTVDTSCDRDDQKCVAKAVGNYKGSGNVLICWEHDALTDIVDALGDKKAPDYPDDS
jgi:hypothetical protein